MLQDHPLFIQGISEFQAGDYYGCHDSLEALWMDAIEPEKTFVQGILQVSVGCYHLTNGNAKGSMILLGEGVKRLKEYQPDFESIDVKTLVESSAQFLATVQTLEADAISAIAQWLQNHPNHGEHWTTPTGVSLRLPTLRQVVS